MLQQGPLLADEKHPATKHQTNKGKPQINMSVPGVSVEIMSLVSIACVIQTYSTVVADTGCLPASIVATGVTLVQLEAVVFVPAHVQQRNTKRPLACQDKPHSFYRMPKSICGFTHRENTLSMLL